MHPDTMEFSDTMFLRTSTLAAGKLCPDQRRVPQLVSAFSFCGRFLVLILVFQGSLFAESVAALLYLVKLPVVIGVSAPRIMDLIAGPCFLDSKSHSLLMNCGAEIFSMEDFFGALYEVNGHFWRIFSITANFLGPGRAQTYINGLTMVGENSAASVYVASAGKVMTKPVENNPTESATQLQDTFTGGSGRFGPMTLFMKTALNPIAGAHWIYRMASRIVVQSIQAAEAKRSIGSVFWNVISEGIADYDELVAKRMFNTCGGLSLMAGYNSPMGKAILHFCFAGVKSTTATLNLVSLFTVDIPVMACVCTQSVGQPHDWILYNCEAPDRTKIMIRRLVDSSNQC